MVGNQGLGIGSFFGRKGKAGRAERAGIGEPHWHLWDGGDW